MMRYCGLDPVPAPKVNHQTLHHPGARNKPAPFDAAKRYIYQQVPADPWYER